MPNISIPLYTIQTKDYQLPISLNYHASGIKVNQEASWVGLGWNLSAGAQIVLEVRDEPGEYNDFINDMPDANKVLTYVQNNPNGYNDSYFQTMKNESWVKDVYNFSSPTASGKFIIDDFATKKISVFPPEAFKVDLSGPRDEKKFIVTYKFGNKYVFDSTREYSVTIQQYQPPLYTSSWLVDKIEIPNGELLEFKYHEAGALLQKNYTDTTIKTTTIDPLAKCKNEEDHYKTESLSSIQTTLFSRFITQTKKIKEILFNGGRVSFEIDRTRQDLTEPSELITGNIAGKLNFIRVESENPDTNNYSTIKNIAFHYSYFTATALTYTPNNYRLRLDKLDDMIGVKKTKFVYSDIELPVKSSKSQDYWGYYNGKANVGLIPKQFIYLTPITGATPILTQVGTANRTVNPETIEAGTLKEIIYPTKGITKFNFEPNTFLGNDMFATYGTVSKTLFGMGNGWEDPMSTPYGISEESISFNAQVIAGSPSQLFFKITGENPVENNHQLGKVSVLKNGVEIFSSHTFTNGYLQVNLGSISGEHVLKLEAYGSTMKVLAYVNYANANIDKNIY